MERGDAIALNVEDTMERLMFCSVLSAVVLLRKSFFLLVRTYVSMYEFIIELTV